jgi:threonine dehydrogenase-like Zn-dependent dehydrogenase
MKAVAIEPGRPGLKIVDRPEPGISAPDAVLLRIVRVGICGTDREEATGGRARPPDGASELVIGREMLGRVDRVGAAVSRLRPGQLAVCTVRRGCGRCRPCAMGRSDMCATGEYRERGIWRLDGYQTEAIVDSEEYMVAVPPELEPIAVLAEPTSVAEKAIEEAVRLQMARLPDAVSTPHWLQGRRCLVTGLGPIGLLAALILTLRGAEVTGMDVVDASTSRPRWLTAIGGAYLDGRQTTPEQLSDRPFDFILDATGVAALEFKLIDALNWNGVYVLTGIPGVGKAVQIPGPELITRLVLRNQVVLGSVNASLNNFEQAIADLAHAQLRWAGHVARLITHRTNPGALPEAIGERGADVIKTVVEWHEAA